MRPELVPVGRRGHQRRPEDRRGRGAAELPAHRRRGTLRRSTTPTPRSPTSTPSTRTCSTGWSGSWTNLRHVIVFGGPAPAGMLSSEDAHRHGVGAARQMSATTVGTGGTMIYTSGTTGKPKGAVRYATDPETGHGPRVPARLPARRHLHDLRAAVPQRTRRVHGHRRCCSARPIVVQRKFDAEDWLRLVEKYKVTSTFSAPALVRMVCALPPR